MDKESALPVISGLAAGIAFMTVFVVYSDYYNSPKPSGSIQPLSAIVQTSTCEPDICYLVLGSQSYPNQYHFGSKDGQILKITVNQTSRVLTVFVKVPTTTTFELDMSSQMEYQLYQRPHATFDGQLAIFTDSLNRNFNETSGRGYEAIQMELSAGTSEIELVGTYY